MPNVLAPAMRIETKPYRARWYENLADNHVRCFLCPHFCMLSPGQIGFCGVRRNLAGELVAEAYGQVVACGIELIEKKPLYHFFPGSHTLSIGLPGCSLRCQYCQNWEIALNPSFIHQTHRRMHPDQVVADALAHRAGFICFTYTEPTVHLEFVEDVARAAHSSGLGIILVTNGYVTPHICREMTGWIDAAKVDLKGDENMYRRTVGAGANPVLNCVDILMRAGVWVELSTVITSDQDDTRVGEMARQILDICGDDVPMHLMRLFPSFHACDAYPTSLSDLRRFREIVRGVGLKFVYISNVPGLKEANTFCPICGAALIERDGTKSKVALQSACCIKCGYAMSGRGL